MNQPVERYCTIEESLRESMKEVKLMREGKLPKRSWAESMKELKEELEEEGFLDEE
ncbi:hypothetical protein [Cellulosilyticum sp. I15G10I2]|uniref:hypothetical protein n=1 Tax=Cellulosilyticum sp. I15G10I2 TaxID=1892843 RepID=UPI0014961DD5|nr:hypothetical protein [Cellulosilyticum sp. I15G10I2]